MNSKRIGLGISSTRRVVMAVPVVGKAGFDLEPLAGEAGIERLGGGEAVRLAERLTNVQLDPYRRLRPNPFRRPIRVEPWRERRPFGPSHDRWPQAPAMNLSVSLALRLGS
jgi:hypothetical protein